MKSALQGVARHGGVSHPARGAWIEIGRKWTLDRRMTSHPARGAWIEIAMYAPCTPAPRSHPARGAWIEIGS